MPELICRNTGDTCPLCEREGWRARDGQTNGHLDQDYPPKMLIIVGLIGIALELELVALVGCWVVELLVNMTP